MRIVGLLVVLCLGAAAVGGCKNKGTDADAAPDPAALKAQQELIARRDKLIEARTKLQEDRDKIDAEIKDIQAKGGDASEQVKKRAELDNQLQTQTSDLDQVSSKVDAAKAGGAGDKSAAVAAREADMASRERTLADREARLAERERQLATRDAESAARWKDSCSMGAAPVIIQQAAPKGGNWTNKDVTALLQKARGAMNKKGLITSDLPGPAQGFEGDATKAMNDNDMSRAYIAAANLLGTIDAIVVNRAFIQQKTARLSAQLKGTKVDEATNKDLQEILGDVMNSYNNGDFTAANRRLNQLATKLAKTP